jgi:hypothetical protein
MTISEKSKVKREKASRLAPLRRHIDVPIFVKTILITALIVALYSQTNIIYSRAFVQLARFFCILYLPITLFRSF